MEVTVLKMINATKIEVFQMNVIELLQKAVVDQASDIFIIAGLPVSYRSNGRILREEGERLMPPQTSEFVQQLYELAQARFWNGEMMTFRLRFRDSPVSVSVLTSSVVHSLRSSVSSLLSCHTRKTSVFLLLS